MNPLAWLAVAVAALGLGFGGWQWAERSVVERQLGLCQSARTQLEVSLDRSGQAVRAWEAAASAAQESGRQARQKAAEVSAQLQARSDELDGLLRGGSGLSCTAAVDRVRRGMQP
jgi:hypothetical protein